MNCLQLHTIFIFFRIIVLSLSSLSDTSLFVFSVLFICLHNFYYLFLCFKMVVGLKIRICMYIVQCQSEL